MFPAYPPPDFPPIIVEPGEILVFRGSPIISSEALTSVTAEVADDLNPHSPQAYAAFVEGNLVVFPGTLATTGDNLLLLRVVGVVERTGEQVRMDIPMNFKGGSKLLIFPGHWSTDPAGRIAAVPDPGGPAQIPNMRKTDEQA